MKSMLTIMATVFLAFTTVSMKVNADEVSPSQDLSVINFKLIAEGSLVAPDHSLNFRGGTATINYQANTVKITLNVTPKCPTGFFCPAVLKMKVVELPIQQIIRDNECYVTVHAVKDMLPADGMLQDIKIDDYSKTTCDFKTKPVSNITYLTTYIDRMKNEEVTATSVIKAEMFDAQIFINQ